MKNALVVGAGVFGLSVARELAGRGWSVQVIDRDWPRPAGPSSAVSRILRLAHGGDSFYTALAWRARTLWTELERESGSPFLLPTGVLHLASSGHDHGHLQASLRCLTELDLPVERIGSAEAARRFSVGAVDLDFAVLEPAGGILLASRALRALADSASRRGVRLTRGAAEPDESGGVRLDRRSLRPDLTVWAPGPALPAVFPGLTSATAVRQDAYYVRASPAGPAPAWIDHGHGAYGIPAVGAQDVKVVPDVTVDAAEELDLTLPENLRAYLCRRFPELAKAPVTRREPCAYAAMPDDDFLLAPHPADERVWIVGGDSGHGFKHGPALGALVCDAIDDHTTIPARFKLR
ncbi:FAD-dependent oxidoreductase [Actinomadura sp. DC4]|uniref:NAD(P)/FAD-dependent oxidoreductase n=1 Tax=Actinomadura sp. DC4 TaxID=3055069 RepID=UPI0025B0F79C|nr:FAD-dependent oxidoreductase [Actinomadura sp. DC4]MDN3355764.1 FAD-dependent oxidoreductase [Actinomadura sp. DC4]